MSDDKVTKSNSIMAKPKDALHKTWLKTALSKNTFQKISQYYPLKKISQYWSLKKCISKLL